MKQYNGVLPMGTMQDSVFPVGSTVGIQQDATLPISDKGGAEEEKQALPIGREQIMKAHETLKKYKAAKKQSDTNIIENENWWRLHHLGYTRKGKRAETDTPSAWLFNSIANKHADAMDNYPSASVLPREPGDKQAAEALTSILPVIMEQTDFEKTWSEAWDYKLKMGKSCYSVTWDNELYNGLGDVSVKKVDILNLFWEPGITELQDSRNLFYVYLTDTDLLEMEYPELEGKLGGKDINVGKYTYEEGLDATGKTSVVDWYYKVKNQMGKTVLHMCKFAGEQVLYATENDPALAERGLYDHGLYPFVLDRLFALEGTLDAMGYIDLMKGVQMRIDRQQCALTEYAAEAMDLRWFVRDDATINQKDYADHKKKFIPVAGPLDEENMKKVEVPPIDAIWVQVLNNNIEELKETSGNRDVNQGGTTSGVTAASGIAAMMEAGSKLSRDMLKNGYRAYREVCNLVLECMRQFYTEQRYFRIIKPEGGMEFVPMSTEIMNVGGKLPVYDVSVRAQKASPYSRMAQNEMVKEFYNLGFFNPQNTDMSLTALRMMDFEGKEEVMQAIEKNGTMMQKLQVMQQLVVQFAQMLPPEDAKKVLGMAQQQGLLEAPAMQQQMHMDRIQTQEGGGSIVEKAAATAREGTAPV